MIRDLINITTDEINKSAVESIASDNTVVIHLQNNGNKVGKLNVENMNVWIEEDIDD